MGKYFSDIVEKALQDIYYDVTTGRGKENFQLLEQASKDGDGDLIPPQPKKAEGIWRTGAELGYPIHQYIYGKELDKAGKKDEALQWHKRAAEGGEAGSWFYIGLAYEEGKIVPKDCRYAAQCYEKGLKPSAGAGCYNRLGALCFDGNGVPQDYERAVSLLTKAFKMGSNWGCDYLGKAYFYGLGTFQDYIRAREFLEKIDWEDKEVSYMLGIIYVQGRGVPANIQKGVEYLKKAGNYKGAKEELVKYKRTLFGKWVHR